MVKYIYKNKRTGKWEIRKRIGGVLLYWGSFTTLEEAKLYRAYYIGKKWMVNPHYQSRENKYIYDQDGQKIIRKRRGGKMDYFGVFDNLKDAIHERDICIACEWDLERIVEFGDVL